MKDIMELARREEELLPELKPYQYNGAFGPAVHHPWVIQIFYDPRRAALINEQYRYKRDAVAKAMREGAWELYVFLHERPYRISALRRAIEAGANNVHELVKSTWTDSENIRQNKAHWMQIWRSLNNPRDVMDANERCVYDSMPEDVVIHRGVRHRTHWPRGMSWTRDKERAVWYAHRFPTKKQVPTVLSAVVKKWSVLAYINARGEEEVVTEPRFLRNVTVDERRQG